VQMRNGFAGIRAVVDDETVTAFAKAEGLRHFGGFEEQMAENLVILGCGVINTRDGLSWNDQDMDRGGGFDVAKSEYEIVLVNNLSRDFACGDLFEQSVTHSQTIVAVEMQRLKLVSALGIRSCEQRNVSHPSLKAPPDPALSPGLGEREKRTQETTRAQAEVRRPESKQVRR
jgi:hypothetical protein